jgi:ribose transport system substrate-binding protein
MRLTSTLLAVAGTAAIFAAVPLARADAFLDQAKATVAAATGRADKWDGPTAGPKAVAGKTVVYIAADLRNGGIQGVANGFQEAAKVIGWDARVIDGQGSVSGIDSAFGQAVALKPAGIVIGGFDILQNAAKIEDAAKAGIKVVAWHGAPKPGPVDGTAVLFNVTTDSAKVAEVAAMYAIAQSDGKAGVVVFTDSAYAIALSKARAMEDVVKKCAGCTVHSFEDSPLADASGRMPQLTTSLLQRFGDKWTYSLAINDLYFDFMGASLISAGKDPAGAPYNISAGDGSESAYERVRTGQFQAATVPEPLTLQGWQLVDELNRAFAGDKQSGYFAPVHLVTKANIEFDGGSKNVFDPDNGYRDAYQKIWGK